jgi:two-component system NtrC family response regulator
MEKLLVVDDNQDIRTQLKWGFGKEYNVIQAGDGKEGISLFKKHQPKVVTLDLGLPPHEDGTEEGFRCLKDILDHSPRTKVIVMTGNDEKNNALMAVQLGAYDFFQKPVDLHELKIIISRAFHLSDIEEENSRLQTALRQKSTGLEGLVGQCAQMQQVFTIIKKVATSDAAVFLTGESGTGKELAARAIHSLSLRANGPFVPINCGAIPGNLLESELFGFEKGAFTGAHARIQGKFEYANKGTLFLDEIGEMPAPLQVKLLRFLQEKVFQRVGGREDIIADTRIISASNIDIVKAIQDGRFREDLYYRTAVISIRLPPLRERGDDILLLANLFLKRSSEKINKKVRGFSASSIEIMKSYDWPGNVRELENKLLRAVIMSDSALLKPEDLGFAGMTPGHALSNMDTGTLKDARDRVEQEMIISAFRRNGGNIAKAAEELKVSRPTLYDLLKKHGLPYGHG